MIFASIDGDVQSCRSRVDQVRTRTHDPKSFAASNCLNVKVAMGVKSRENLNELFSKQSEHIKIK